MKRVIIVFIAIIAATVVGNAQFFVEGDLGVSFLKHSYEFDNVQNPSSTLSIDVSPQVGYWMNDKVAVGARVSFTTRHNKSLTTNADEQRIEVKNWTPGWSVSVLGRYKFWGSEKFSVLAESYVEIGGNISKERIGSVTKEVNSMSFIGIHVVPIATYDLSEKFSVKAMCDFLNLGYDFFRVKYENNHKATNSHFGFGLQSSTSVRIGFIYNF